VREREKEAEAERKKMKKRGAIKREFTKCGKKISGI
jgi:hypothetical protein